MDRIHRLGQHRPVQAIKLVVEDSIESRIIQVRLYHDSVEKYLLNDFGSSKRRNPLWLMQRCQLMTQCVFFHLFRGYLLT
jgi:hypothetical protein